MGEVATLYLHEVRHVRHQIRNVAALGLLEHVAQVLHLAPSGQRDQREVGATT